MVLPVSRENRQTYRSLSASIALVLLLAVRAAAAEDRVTIGTASAAPQGVARVPVYLRDVSGTALGIDAGTGNRIEALIFKVTHSPASSVASISFERAGVALAVNPEYERSVQSPGSFGYFAGYSETSGHLPLTLNAAEPGDRIGTLVVTLSPQAVVGSTVVLSIDATTATVSNDRGTIGETVSNGQLALTPGSVSVDAATQTVLTSSINPSVVGQSVTFTAMTTSPVTGTLTGQVTFRKQGTVLGVAPVVDSKALLTISSLSQGSHSISAEYSGDDTFAPSVSDVLTQTVTISPFGAPPGVTATAMSSSLVSITWWPVSGASYYEVRRTYDNGPYVLIGSTSSAFLNDTGVQPGITYLYLVRAIKSNATSPDSHLVAATTIPFTDDPVAPMSTTVRAAHLLELRAAVNAFRKSAGLDPASFSDPALSGTPVRAIHIQELRTSLTEALTALGLSVPEFSAGALPGSWARAAHIEELRATVK